MYTDVLKHIVELEITVMYKNFQLSQLSVKPVRTAKFVEAGSILNRITPTTAKEGWDRILAFS